MAPDYNEINDLMHLSCVHTKPRTHLVSSGLLSIFVLVKESQSWDLSWHLESASLNTVDSSFLLSCGAPDSLGGIFAWGTERLPLLSRQTRSPPVCMAWQTECSRALLPLTPSVRHILGMTQPEQLYRQPWCRVPRTTEYSSYMVAIYVQDSSLNK